MRNSAVYSAYWEKKEGKEEGRCSVKGNWVTVVFLRAGKMLPAVRGTGGWRWNTKGEDEACTQETKKSG